MIVSDMLFGVQIFMSRLFSTLLAPLGLSVIWTESLNESFELSEKYLMLNERALMDRLLLLDLEAEKVGYKVFWTEGEEHFLMIMQDEHRDFVQTLSGVDEALALVREHVAVIIKPVVAGKPLS